MTIQAFEFSSIEQEMSFVALEIKKSIKDGTLNEEIAVIARTNNELSFFSKYLKAEQIQFNHPKALNLLENPAIVNFLNILEYISSLLKNENQSDYLLPSVLAIPFFGFKAVDIFELSLIAKKNRQGWLEAMLNSEKEEFSQLAGFFLEVAKIAKTEAVVLVIEKVLGFSSVDIENKEQLKVKFTSPFKNWYLQNDINQESKKNEYVEFLWQVNDLITSILKEKETELMLLDHFLEIVKEYQLNQLNISSKIPDMTKNINLLTAHKAKGLEFEKVFVIGCSKGKWSSSKSKEIIKFPINLPINSLPENNDDFLRLLFVAITRAKTDLVFTNTIDIEKKDTQWIISLQKAFEENGIEIQKPKVDVNLETILPAIFEKNFSQALDVSKVFEEQDLLGLLNTILDKYKMSASDLTMYLDIVRSGPISLLEKKILKFPSSSSLQQEVGILIHEILFEYYLIWNKQQSQAQIEDLIAILDKKIQKYTVKKQDKEKLYYIVSKNLHLYNEQKIKHWVKGSEVEKDFTKMDVVLDYEEVRVPLTGKIDRLDFDHQNKLITIVDYKSGKPFSSWEPETDKKISSWNYRLQLYFYKILVECSGVYPDYQIKSAKLEFLKPEAQTDILYTLDLEYDDFETERVKKLITKVYSKIITKDFPIFNEKSKSYKRVLKFEADILGEPSEFVDKLEEDN